MVTRALFSIFATLAITTAATSFAQDFNSSPEIRLKRIQRDQLKDQFGADHPVVIELDSDIRRQGNSDQKPERVRTDPTKIEDLEYKSLRRLVIHMLTRIVSLEKEVATLKTRISELEASGKP